LRVEVLKPLGPSDDAGFVPDGELAVIGVAITQFGEGWDLPPGVRDDSVGLECGGDCEGEPEEDRPVDARFEDFGGEGVDQDPMLDPEDEDDGE
jgi:hypothetical protein